MIVMLMFIVGGIVFGFLENRETVFHFPFLFMKLCRFSGFHSEKNLATDSFLLSVQPCRLCSNQDDEERAIGIALHVSWYPREIFLQCGKDVIPSKDGRGGNSTESQECS